MNDTWSLLISLVTGIALGAIFFGGLWLTVQKGVTSHRPALWLIVSVLFRVSITLTGFYFIGRGHWIRMMVCLLGFIMARLIVKWLIQLRDKQARAEQEDNHEPQS